MPTLDVQSASSATEEPPRIVVATLARPTGATGVQTHFNAFLAYLHDRRLPSVLLTPFTYNRLLALVVFSVRMFLGPLSPALNVWWFERWHFAFLRAALRDFLYNAGPVVVYAQCPLSAKAALEARVSREQLVVLAVHFNGSVAEEWVGLLGLKRDGRVFRSILDRDRKTMTGVDGIVYVSTFVRDAVESECPSLASVTSIVLPNFISPATNHDDTLVHDDLVTIGTLEHRKNQAYLLRVLASAKRRGKVYGLTVIGNGPSRAALESLARSLGIDRQVRFLGTQPDARRFLRGHRAYVHSARTESFGIVLIEAMASGLPLCAAPTGGIPEVFEDGQQGFYWPLDNPDEGARRLITLMENPDLYRKMSAAAIGRFHERFDVAAGGARLLEFLTGMKRRA